MPFTSPGAVSISLSLQQSFGFCNHPSHSQLAVSYLLVLSRAVSALLRSDYTLIELLAWCFPPGLSAVLISQSDNCLRLILAFWLGLSAIWPFIITMVQTHLHLRYASVLAWQLPQLARSISAFYPRFILLVATQQHRGYAFTPALGGPDLGRNPAQGCVISYQGSLEPS